MYILIHLPDEEGSEWLTNLWQKLKDAPPDKKGAIIRLPQSPVRFADLKLVASRMGEQPGVSITCVAEPPKSEEA